MRIKRGVTTKRKHKKLLEETRGYRMTRHRLVKVAREAFLHAGQYAYGGRRKKKGQFRRLWISRVSGSLKDLGMTYSKFIEGLKKKNIILDRKILSYLATNDRDVFKKIVDTVKTV